MLLYRLDAEHELNGSLARFYQLEIAAHTAARSLEATGWCCDVYAVDLAITPQTAQRLKSGTWPNAAEEQLLLLAADPATMAKVDLDRIVALKGAS